MEVISARANGESSQYSHRATLIKFRRFLRSASSISSWVLVRLCSTLGSSFCISETSSTACSRAAIRYAPAMRSFTCSDARAGSGKSEAIAPQSPPKHMPSQGETPSPKPARMSPLLATLRMVEISGSIAHRPCTCSPKVRLSAPKPMHMATMPPSLPSVASGTKTVASARPMKPPEAAIHQPSRVSPSVGFAVAKLNTTSQTERCRKAGADGCSTRSSASVSERPTRRHHSTTGDGFNALRSPPMRGMSPRFQAFVLAKAVPSSPAPAPVACPVFFGLPG
mmetsp:Transcript_51981/g.119580  ORF Transcript_51981/g.119580 Transcript_51981/m.119580 type:complete len:281 (-) Transcript_51981:781-1623(-)